jgi:hypothetical protein
MNNLLLQMIAARATGGGNPALADMLARVRAAGGCSPIQDPSQLLSQLGNGNALLDALSKHYAEARTNGSAQQPLPKAVEEVIDVEPEPARSESRAQNGHGKNDDAAESVDELKGQVRSLQAEIKTLRERCDLLASTVGACCLCWGQDPNCRACRGRGKPGYAIPDEGLFGEFVLPAMRVLRAQKVRPNRPPAVPPGPQSGAESSTPIS